ncbi:MAG: glycosyltransferase [Bacteroidota bacterium]|nr:glycosyltransferase [Bacteroidota bacterium]
MKTKPKKILVVVGYQPFPTYFGGAVDVWKRIVGLHRLGHLVYLAFTEKQRPNPADLTHIKQYVQNVFFVPRNNKITDLIKRNPLQVESRNELKTIEFTQKYDLLIAEGEFVGAILENPTLKYNKLFVRVHNDESLYFKQLRLSTSSLPKKIYYSLEIPKIKHYSQKIFRKADRLWYISADEFKLSEFPRKSVFLPAPVDSNFTKYQYKTSQKVLFVGSLFMPNNIYAVDWYLNNVHQQLFDYQDYELIIVGSVKNISEKEALIAKYTLPRVSLYFNQQDLAPFYTEAQLFINPMFHGSGVKIKSIDAITHGLPLVSTNIGAEGIGLTEAMFYRANTPNEFVRQIKTIFEQNNTSVEQKVCLAQQHLEDNHYLTVLENEINQL